MRVQGRSIGVLRLAADLASAATSPHISGFGFRV